MKLAKHLARLNEYETNNKLSIFFFFKFWLHDMARRISGPQPGSEPASPGLEAPRLNLLGKSW